MSDVMSSHISLELPQFLCSEATKQELISALSQLAVPQVPIIIVLVVPPNGIWICQN